MGCDRRVLLETLRGCEERKDGVVLWGMHLSKCVKSFPSLELGEVLVSHQQLTHSPSLWKFLHYSLSSTSLLSPLHVLSLLSSRVIPLRQSQPGAYRLYLELLRRHAFSFDPIVADACKDKFVKSIDVALQLSKTFEFQVSEVGHARVLSFFATVGSLIDAIFEDCGLQTARGTIDDGDDRNMDVDFDFDLDKRETNALVVVVVDVLAEITENKKAMVLLRLVHVNMPETFNALWRKIQFLDANKTSSPKLKCASPFLSKLCTNIHKTLVLNDEMSKRQLIGILGGESGRETGQFALWVPFDICMENAMDGKQFPVASAVDILAETIHTLKVFKGASWQETFLALWLSALRVVQRERDPLEGPVPHLEARLCVLLSIAPLSVARVLEDGPSDSSSKRHGLLSSLQALGLYSSLLCPPASVVSAANGAIAKAARFLSKTNPVKNATNNTVGGCDTFVKAGGDMRHLVVEACIARKLIDRSAYVWPGYVSPSTISQPDPSPLQRSPWSTFMEGAPLTGPLINALTVNPASSLEEVEKLYHIALNGVEEERSAAAKILCGVSLSRAWNVQEHVVRVVVKLLSPPIPPDYTGSRSHLLDHMPMISSILYGITFIDTVHILSLHGVVPEVAAALIPLCEAFGCLVPSSGRKLTTYDESLVYMVFSSAFLFLLRLWKFYRPPLEQCMTGRGGVIGGELTLEYLLLLRNSRIPPSASERPIYVDSYPKLRAWYCQNKSCIASTLSGLSSGSPVREVANKILDALFWKMNRDGTDSSAASGSAAATEESSRMPLLPAWEILEAVPYVLEAVLTACAHGRLSSRDLTTGLRDLADFLPATLAAMITYLSAEVTRGIWKPVVMNGVDWPSPAANFASVESQIKEILTAAGVDLPTSFGFSQAMFPLPMAALVSLTITFKLDKNLEFVHAVVGPALENCASDCPWPGMLIIGSLWAQKVRSWHDFIVVSCSRSVFRDNQEAVGQLLHSCFASFLGSSNTSGTVSGIKGLLGTFISSRDTRPPVAPGFLYLRSCRTIHNVPYVNNVIVALVAEFATSRGSKPGSHRLNSARSSLAVAVSRAKEAASLGASLLCVAGGVELVRELFKDTMPTWFLSTRKVRVDDTGSTSVLVEGIVEGYAMAYLLVLSGALAWGVGKRDPSWPAARRLSAVGVHMDFMARAVDGEVPIGCNGTTWKAYVRCVVGMMAGLAPEWIGEVKECTLRKLAHGLRRWNEPELAMLLLERGGPGAMGLVAEHLNMI